MNSTYWNSERISSVVGAVSILDYCFHLEHRGLIRYRGLTGTHHYFTAPGVKMAVTGSHYFDFKKSKGGGVLQAVMDFERVGFLEALEYLQDFSGLHPDLVSYIKESKEREIRAQKNYRAPEILRISKLRSFALSNYFRMRGISVGVIAAYTLEYLFVLKGHKVRALGLKNVLGGLELHSQKLKMKLGPSSYSVISPKIPQENETLIVFEGMTDLLSFVEWQDRKRRSIKRTLICLNSVGMVSRFVKDYKGFEGKVLLLLDGDSAGEEATNALKEGLSQAQVKDLRPCFQISKYGLNDFNEFLVAQPPYLIKPKKGKLLS